MDTPTTYCFTPDYQLDMDLHAGIIFVTDNHSTKVNDSHIVVLSSVPVAVPLSIVQER